MVDLGADRRRQLEESRRRRHSSTDLYAPWNRAERWMVDERKRLAAELLHRRGVFPQCRSRCLEIGFGHGGWLPTLLDWRVAEDHLFGVEIDLHRAADTGRRLPGARLCLGDGGRLPYATGSFHLVITSTVFTSILDPQVRVQVAAEIQRVLSPSGALLWYDFAVNNPRNSQVRGVSRRELSQLFSGLKGDVCSITLAPPILRRVAPVSLTAAQALSSLPFLRTHLLALLKPC